MRAADLQVHLPLVDRDTTAVDAARLIADGRLAGLVIADKSGDRVALVSAIDVLGLLVPGYVLDDMALAGVFDDIADEEVWAHAERRKLGELVDDDSVRIRDILRIDADATLIEVAAQMADARTHIAQVRSPEPGPPGFLLLPTVMEAILAYCAPGAGSTAG